MLILILMMTMLGTNFEGVTSVGLTQSTEYPSSNFVDSSTVRAYSSIIPSQSPNSYFLSSSILPLRHSGMLHASEASSSTTSISSVFSSSLIISHPNISSSSLLVPTSNNSTVPPYSSTPTESEQSSQSLYSSPLSSFYFPTYSSISTYDTIPPSSQVYSEFIPTSTVDSTSITSSLHSTTSVISVSSHSSQGVISSPLYPIDSSSVGDTLNPSTSAFTFVSTRASFPTHSTRITTLPIPSDNASQPNNTASSLSSSFGYEKHSQTSSSIVSSLSSVDTSISTNSSVPLSSSSSYLGFNYSLSVTSVGSKTSMEYPSSNFVDSSTVLAYSSIIPSQVLSSSFLSSSILPSRHSGMLHASEASSLDYSLSSFFSSSLIVSHPTVSSTSIPPLMSSSTSSSLLVSALNTSTVPPYSSAESKLSTTQSLYSSPLSSFHFPTYSSLSTYDTIPPSSQVYSEFIPTSIVNSTSITSSLQSTTSAIPVSSHSSQKVISSPLYPIYSSSIGDTLSPSTSASSLPSLSGYIPTNSSVPLSSSSSYLGLNYSLSVTSVGSKTSMEYPSSNFVDSSIIQAYSSTSSVQILGSSFLSSSIRPSRHSVLHASEASSFENSISSFLSSSLIVSHPTVSSTGIPPLMSSSTSSSLLLTTRTTSLIASQTLNTSTANQYSSTESKQYSQSLYSSPLSSFHFPTYNSISTYDTIPPSSQVYSEFIPTSTVDSASITSSLQSTTSVISISSHSSQGVVSSPLYPIDSSSIGDTLSPSTSAYTFVSTRASIPTHSSRITALPIPSYNDSQPNNTAFSLSSSFGYEKHSQTSSSIVSSLSSVDTSISTNSSVPHSSSSSYLGLNYSLSVTSVGSKTSMEYPSSNSVDSSSVQAYSSISPSQVLSSSFLSSSILPSRHSGMLHSSEASSFTTSISSFIISHPTVLSTSIPPIMSSSTSSSLLVSALNTSTVPPYSSAESKQSSTQSIYSFYSSISTYDTIPPSSQVYSESIPTSTVDSTSITSSLQSTTSVIPVSSHSSHGVVSSPLYLIDSSSVGDTLSPTSASSLPSLSSYISTNSSVPLSSSSGYLGLNYSLSVTSVGSKASMEYPSSNFVDSSIIQAYSSTSSVQSLGSSFLSSSILPSRHSVLHASEAGSFENSLSSFFSSSLIISHSTVSSTGIPPLMSSSTSSSLLVPALNTSTVPPYSSAESKQYSTQSIYSFYSSISTYDTIPPSSQVYLEFIPTSIVDSTSITSSLQSTTSVIPVSRHSSQGVISSPLYSIDSSSIGDTLSPSTSAFTFVSTRASIPTHSTRITALPTSSDNASQPNNTASSLNSYFGYQEHSQTNSINVTSLPSVSTSISSFFSSSLIISHPTVSSTSIPPLMSSSTYSSLLVPTRTTSLIASQTLNTSTANQYSSTESKQYSQSLYSSPHSYFPTYSSISTYDTIPPSSQVYSEFIPTSTVDSTSITSSLQSTTSVIPISSHSSQGVVSSPLYPIDSSSVRDTLSPSTSAYTFVSTRASIPTHSSRMTALPTSYNASQPNNTASSLNSSFGYEKHSQTSSSIVSSLSSLSTYISTNSSVPHSSSSSYLGLNYSLSVTSVGSKTSMEYPSSNSVDSSSFQAYSSISPSQVLSSSFLSSSILPSRHSGMLHASEASSFTTSLSSFLSSSLIISHPIVLSTSIPPIMSSSTSSSLLVSTLNTSTVPLYSSAESKQPSTQSIYSFYSSISTYDTIPPSSQVYSEFIPTSTVDSTSITSSLQSTTSAIPISSHSSQGVVSSPLYPIDSSSVGDTLSPSTSASSLPSLSSYISAHSSVPLSSSSGYLDSTIHSGMLEETTNLPSVSQPLLSTSPSPSSTPIPETVPFTSSLSSFTSFDNTIYTSYVSTLLAQQTRALATNSYPNIQTSTSPPSSISTSLKIIRQIPSSSRYPVHSKIRFKSSINTPVATHTPTPTPINYNITIEGPSVTYIMHSVSLSCYIYPVPISLVVFRWFLDGDIYKDSQNISFYAPSIPVQEFACEAYKGSFDAGNSLARAQFEVRIGYISSLELITTAEQNRTNSFLTELTCETTQTIDGNVAYLWSYIGNDNNQQEIYGTSSYIQIVEHTLTIIATDPVRSGVYVCSATLDGMASTRKSLSTTVQIYSPTQVSLEQPSEGDVFNLLENSIFKITCNITGLETPRVRWLVNGISPNYTSITLITDITEPVLNSQNVSTSLSHIQTSLTFTRVSLDIKLVTCIAINSLGSFSNQSVFEVERLGRPCAPVELQEVDSGSEWSLLEWKLNNNCEDKYLYISSYVLEYAGSGGVSNGMDVPREEKEETHTFNLTGLIANTAYQIRVSAKNKYGESEYTDRITVVTLPVDKKVMFYYGKENGDSEMEHGYYSQSPALATAASIPVGTRRIESVYVSPFGTLSLDRRSYLFQPTSFPLNNTQTLFLLAPFWSDIDYRERGAISYRVYQSGIDSVHTQVMERATQLSRSHANADTNFTALAVIVATWAQVEPWGYLTKYAGVNTFQAAIVTDYEQSYVLFGYNCGEMTWSSSATYPTSPVIGFNAGGIIYSNNYLSNQPSSHKIGCILKTESNPVAVVGYQISLNLSQVNPAELACFKWFGHDLSVNSHLPNSAKQAFPCPCNLFQAFVDGRYRYDHVAGYSGIYKAHVVCFVSRFSVLGNYQRCCYDLSPDSPSAGFISSIFFTPVTKSGKQRGSILSTNPIFSSESYQLYKERDEEGYAQCCLLSDKCDLFFTRRPSQDCTGYIFRPFTWGFGDPHVISMDGFKYTFNGIGEYWYLFPIGECDFQVQARTQPIRDTKATVFTGIAVKIKNCSTVFVSLLGTDELSLFVDQQNKTDEIRSTGEFMEDCLNIEYFKANGTKKPEIKVVYKNGAFLNVAASIELITMNFSLPDTCKDRTQGLIGQWDGDASNDLLMRNGTLLSQNVTDREKEVFADSWRLTEDESFMVYETGNYSTNNPTEASPLYLDEFIENANISLEVEQLCNGDSACLFDAVVTNDTSIAMGTVFISVDTQETVAEGNNIPPLILTPPSLYLSLDNLTAFEFNVTDEDPFSVSVSLSPQSAFTDVTLHNVTTNQHQLQVRLTVIPDSMNVTIVANDSVGASVVIVYVVVCHCDNGGYCSEVVPGTPLGESGYVRSSCQCPLLYEGMYCSDVVEDPCLQTACSTEACPSGTEMNDISLKCEDFDECETECLGFTRLCENTYGSYLCTCALGYMEVEEECVDLNECNAIIPPCQQQCNNTIGSFVCGCDSGYALQPDQSTCKAVSNTISCPAGYSCEDNECTMRGADTICTYCERGTELSSDGRTCIDIDECVLQHDICPSLISTCNNTYASYYCQCNQGYSANSQGVCADMNECISAQPVCGELELCMNNPGSYVCVSNCYHNGMEIMNGGICQDNRPPENKTVTRVPLNEEIIAITFSLNISKLRLSLELRNSSLSDMYAALAETLETPLTQIEIVETVGSAGTLELLLISNHFQIEPRFTAGLLRSPINQHWAPYFAFVVTVITSQRETILRGNFSLRTILISGISVTISFTLLLLCMASLWIYFNAKRVRDTVQSPRIPPDRNVLHGTRAVISAYLPEYTLSQGAIDSSSLTISQLTSLMSPEGEHYINNQFKLLPDATMPTYNIPPACELKNRFTNILPPPHSRVPLFLKYGLPNSDYINANFIRGYKKVPRVYIATQAPMFNTEQDFWRMVWEHDVQTIIMLTEIIEHSTEQCYPYWPDYNVIDSLKSGQILIVARDKVVKEDYQVSNFILKHKGTDEIHEVTHYWYRKWPEYGVPSNPRSLVSFLLETRAEPRTSSHPVVVHCASGTGRTGVVLAVDIGMQELEERHSVDILLIASLLRQDRGGLIQTREQYHLLYKALCAYARYVYGQGENS